MMKRLSLVASVCLAKMSPAVANPLAAPTVQYVAEVETTRGSERLPVRHVYAGRKVRMEMGKAVFLFDLDRQEFVILAPKLAGYSGPLPFGERIEDGRRWVGVEAETADAVGSGILLGRKVTKYKVRGRVSESRSPFEGEVWTTAENIVLRVDGIGQFPDGARSIKIRTVKLTVGRVDSRLFAVPANYHKMQ